MPCLACNKQLSSVISHRCCHLVVYDRSCTVLPAVRVLGGTGTLFANNQRCRNAVPSRPNALEPIGISIGLAILCAHARDQQTDHGTSDIRSSSPHRERLAVPPNVNNHLHIQQRSARFSGSQRLMTSPGYPGREKRQCCERCRLFSATEFARRS